MKWCHIFLLCAALGGCASTSRLPSSASGIGDIAASPHRGADDLLTAGLGEAGLRNPLPPAFADPVRPTASELRRRAIWSNWRGVADLAPGGGYGEIYGSLAAVPGREFHAFARLPGANQPHRLMLQLPDAFDAEKRCVLVTASSGSRGIYGAIALAGAWGLARGCAVAYTDKGAGTGYVEVREGRGPGLDGRNADLVPGQQDGRVAVEFELTPQAGSQHALVATKHAHSGDNPEADWDRHVLQAARFALQVLNTELSSARPFTPGNTRIIAVGVSNGGGAVLRAAGNAEGWLDGVVAISPNILPGEGGRALYDYATEATLWMPCALNAEAYDSVAMARPGGARSTAGQQRCASLAAAGLMDATVAQGQAEAARQHLMRAGWTDAAIAAGAISTGFDLWRSVVVTYASSYARSGPQAMPCGYDFRLSAADGSPRAATPAERAAWWSDASGIPPGAGVAIGDGRAAGADPAWPGLLCLRQLWLGQGDGARGLASSVAATRARLPGSKLPVLVLHGLDDGLIPEAFSSAAYVHWIRRHGRESGYWRVPNAQHFDALLGLPPLAVRYLPMLPYGYRGLDAMWLRVSSGQPLPADAVFATMPRGLREAEPMPLRKDNLGLEAH